MADVINVPRFFVPQATKSQQEAAYEAIVAHLKDQLRWPITPRRIYSLRYTHDKKDFYVRVGELEPTTDEFQVMAIFESNTYLVFTRRSNGENGVTVLVSKDEVYEHTDFS